eukprot:scaffold2504_cov405-Prasinococcus_capsulatus_cf.AAC.7
MILGCERLQPYLCLSSSGGTRTRLEQQLPKPAASAGANAANAGIPDRVFFAISYVGKKTLDEGADVAIEPVTIDTRLNHGQDIMQSALAPGTHSVLPASPLYKLLTPLALACTTNTCPRPR